MRGPGLCLDESYIDLGSPRLALQRDTLGFTRVKLPVCAAFCSGTGLRSLYHPLSHFGTGKPSSFFSTLSIWGFSTADKSFVLGQLLKVVHGGKQNVLSNRDFPRTGDHI